MQQYQTSVHRTSYNICFESDRVKTSFFLHFVINLTRLMTKKTLMSSKNAKAYTNIHAQTGKVGGGDGDVEQM